MSGKLQKPGGKLDDTQISRQGRLCRRTRMQQVSEEGIDGHEDLLDIIKGECNRLHGGYCSGPGKKMITWAL